MKRILSLFCAPIVLGAFAAPAAAIVMDGTLDAEYITLHTQATQTDYGNATFTGTVFANGSELDAFHYYLDGSDLYIFLGGNLEDNGNKLEIFIDSQPAGQNQLRGDNAGDVNRMGDDGSGNGLKFDAGFESDYWLSVNVFAGNLYADYAETNTGGGGTGYYLGQSTPGGDGTLSGGTNPLGIAATIDNSNTGGVDAGCGAGSGAGVSTGVELKIPLTAIGSPVGVVKFSAFVNDVFHANVSNQVFGSLPNGTCILGEPRDVDFSLFAGDQFVVTGTVPVELSRFVID